MLPSSYGLPTRSRVAKGSGPRAAVSHKAVKEHVHWIGVGTIVERAVLGV